MQKNKSLSSYFSTYERHISGAAFILGFMLDSLVLPRIDFWGTYAILGFYLLFVMSTIFLTVLCDVHHSLKKYCHRFVSFIPAITQFFFGSLMSAIFIYYSRSATIAESTPFMLLLLAIFIGNEIFRDRLRRLEFQVAMLFFIIFMGMTFAVPVFLGAMGPWIFLLSGAISVIAIVLFIFLLRFFAPPIVSKALRVFIWSISGILIVINVLYFTHLIPPIPLSMRVAGVYHHVERTPNGTYSVSGEKRTLRERLTHSYPVVHLDGNPLYFFSAIFAPTTFSTSIVHVWQFYDKDAKKWVTKYRFPFPIIGGREGGYRGYSIKTNVIPGHWRVRVETVRGELLGSSTFIAVLTETSILYEESTL